MQLNLKDKVVLVTGGSRGIGAAICRQFVNEGSRVYFTYKSDDIAADSLLNDIKKNYPDCFIKAIKVDLNNYTECEKKVHEIIESENAIDVLVNNAGITNDGFFLMQSFDEWYKVIQTNLIASIRFTKEVSFEMLTQRRGCIVNISSIAGLKGVIGQTNYCTAKAGMIGFTKSLANELGAKGIRVNAVAPGYISTDLTRNLKESKTMITSIPMRRMGTVDEIANIVLFLSSDASSYVNGAVISVDGGLTA